MTNKRTVNITAESDTVPMATQGNIRDPIEVEGTPGRIAKFATATMLTDSIITESAGRIGIGTATPTAPTATLNVTTTDGSVGVLGESTTTAGVGVYGRSAGIGMIGESTNSVGVFGSSASAHSGVVGVSTSGNGVYGGSPYSEASGVAGFNGASVGGVGVSGVCPNGWGVFGRAEITDGVGVLGQAHSGTGVGGSSDSGTGVYGGSVSGYAGFFRGQVHVTGTLSQGGGGFEIDHPLDPANKYLCHSFVQSPDRMNVYNGNVTTDANGEASVTLPAYFETLNQDFRYQLTVIGQFAQAIVAQEIRHSLFMIKTDQPQVKVSWQVTGIRQDPWAVSNRMAAEEEKAAEDKGRYLHPELWGQPEEARVHWSPLRIDRARLKEEWQQMEELGQRMHQRVPWKEGEGPTSPENP
jgi:hypothetical protein